MMTIQKCRCPTNPHGYRQPPQSISLSKKEGSFLTLFSNFVHQSWNAFNGTTSTPAVPLDPGTGTFPAKDAKKLNAFFIILCARTVVVVGAGLLPANTNEVPPSEDELFVCKAAIFADTSSPDSTETPRIISAADGASMSTSAPFVTSPCTPLTLKIALSLPGPMPPRNLKSFAFGAAPGFGTTAMYTEAAVFGGSSIPGRMNTTMWEKDLEGRLYMNEVGVGAEVGLMIIGEPVGITPKIGAVEDIVDAVFCS